MLVSLHTQTATIDANKPNVITRGADHRSVIFA